MKLKLCLAVALFFIGLDQGAARLADSKLRPSILDQDNINELLPSSDQLNNRARKVCRNQPFLLFYRYQVCLRPYVASESEIDHGWHYVYHRPKPVLSLIMPARDPESFYFQESVQGEFLLFVRRDGTIEMGDGR